MTNTKLDPIVANKTLDKYTKRELEKMTRLADREIAEWREFSTTVKKEIRRRNLIASKKNVTKEAA